LQRAFERRLFTAVDREAVLQLDFDDRVGEPTLIQRWPAGASQNLLNTERQSGCQIERL